MGFDCFVYWFEYVFQSGQFVYCVVQWVVWVDVGEVQCCLFDIGVGKGVDVEVYVGGWVQVVSGVYVQQDCGDFQQGVVVGVKVFGFNVYYYWQEVVEVQGQGWVLISYVFFSQWLICYLIIVFWDR